MQTGLTHDPVLTPEQLARLTISSEMEPFDGDARLFRLGVEARRLGLAYEYDPFFSLSIARVDPLPHQLEAVYDYFLRLPRIRFLLGDDPGAGKTIMAGLLIVELKARGLIRRILIVTSANLTFQWQRELADKFREKFDIIRGDVLRANYGQNPWQVRPGKQVLRWRGTVPPQKWMNFYTKVLTRFASSPELKLEVSIEIPIDQERAQSKADETKSGLKELGLDETSPFRERQLGSREEHSGFGSPESGLGEKLSDSLVNRPLGVTDPFPLGPYPESSNGGTGGLTYPAYVKSVAFALSDATSHLYSPLCPM